MKAGHYRNWFLLSFLVGALLAASCNNAGNSDSPAGGDKSGGKKLRLAFVTNNPSDFWTIARKGTEKAQSELPNATIEFKINEGTAADQQRLVDDLVAKGIDGIAISPVDPKNQTQMLNRVAGQAMVVTQDSDAPDSQRAFYIGTNNVAAGEQAGKLVKEALPQGGKIMVFVGMLDAQNAKERYQGLQKALEGSNIKIVDIRQDNTDRVRAKSNPADALVKEADLVGMVGLWSYNGPAILSAVKEANKIGKVKIIAFDEEDDTLAGIKDGSIYATVVQQPYEFGYQSMKLMAQALGGDKSVIPASKQIFVDTLAIKKDDVEAFIAKINKLRGRS
ncbi:MAG: sugar-binding protein [Blastocatellia bacterium]